MTNARIINTAASWRATAAYLYTLDLDGPALAWEYLRRDAGYQQAWRAAHRRLDARQWGCACPEDPRLDAQSVCPIWSSDFDSLMQVQTARRRAGPNGKCFSVWRPPGRKQLIHRGDCLSFAITTGEQHLQVVLDEAIAEGSAFVCAVRLEHDLKRRLDHFQDEARLLDGEVPPPHGRRLSRATLLHLRALQALDGLRDGASHRDIAGVIFGADAARERWSADSELRAQVRYLIERAQDLVHGGYRELAKLSSPLSTTPETTASAQSLPSPMP